MGLKINNSLRRKIYKLKAVSLTASFTVAVVLGTLFYGLISPTNNAAADYLKFTPNYFIGDKLTPKSSDSSGLAQDTAGNTYIADIRGHLKKVAPDGSFVQNFGRTGSTAGTFAGSYGPVGIATDSIGNVYAVDKIRHVVNKFDPSGTLLYTLGTYNVFGAADGQFRNPHWVAVDASDNLYVTDTGNNRVQKFNSTGGFVWKSGTLGAGDGQFSSPKIITLNSAGVLYVSESGNSRIQKISSTTGAYVGKFTYTAGGCNLGHANGMGFDASDNLYVSTSSFLCSPVFIFNAADAYTSTLSFGNYVFALTVTSDQHLLFIKSTLTIAGEQTTSEVYETDLAGVMINQYGSGLGNGQLREPGMTAEDSAGNVYVVDSRNFHIQKFDSSGNFIQTISSYGTANGQIASGTTDIAIDTADNLYIIARTATGRIDRYDSTGTYSTSFTLNSYPVGSGYIASPTHLDVTNDGLLHVQDGSTIRTYNATTGAYVRSTTMPYSMNDFTSDGTRLYGVGSNRVMVVNNGVVERSFSTSVTAGNTHDGLGAFSASTSTITIDGYGNIYVPGNDGSIGVFTNSGTFIYRFGSYMGMYSWSGTIISRTLYMRASRTTGAFYYNGDYDYIEVSSPIIVTTPGAPRNVTANSPQPGVVNVAWDPPISDGGSAVYEYDISVFSTPYGKWSHLATIAAPTTNATVHIPAGAYTVHVSARNNAGIGANSVDTADFAVTAPYSYTASFNVDPTSHITAVVADSTGTYYATDDYNSRVIVLDDTGATLRTFGEADLSGPSDIALGPDGNLYVSDEYWDKIFVYDKDGTLLRSFGDSGNADGQLYSPSKLNFDNDGNLLIVNTYGTEKIQRFDTSGNFLGRVAPQITTPLSLGTDKDGNLYVGHTSSLISKLTPDGTTELLQVGSDGSGDGEFIEVLNIVVNNDGQIIASDPWNYRIQVLNPDGTYNSQFGFESDTEAFTGINGDGQLDIDAVGNLYVSNPYITPPSISIYAARLITSPEPTPEPEPGPITNSPAPSPLASTGVNQITLLAGAIGLAGAGLVSIALLRHKQRSR